MSAMAACYASYELAAHTPSSVACGPQTAAAVSRSQTTAASSVQKDYSRPLHVDCSVEYELPNQAKPPAGVRNEPLLMIHPCYFRKIESQRRSPFVNNLPTRPPQPQPQQSQQHHTTSSTTAPVMPTAVVSASAAKRRLAAARGQQLPQQVPQQAAQYPVQYADTINRQHQQQLWDHHAMPSLMAASQTPAYCAATASKQRDAAAAAAMLANVNSVLGGGGTTCGGSYAPTTADTASVLGGAHCWTEPDRSPDRPDDGLLSAGGGVAGGGKHILTGKYRQYLRAHRLHPYVTSAIPLASTFPQIHQQVCYNV